MTSRQRKRLQKILTMMKSCTESGVPGVLKIVGKKPGIVLGISVCTHGNEPSGLAALDYLWNELDLQKRLNRGAVYFVVNNLEAAENYLWNGERGKNNRYRLIDWNMNRLPEDMLHLTNDKRYEVQRAQELFPIWQQLEVGFDIHSTTQDSPPMLIGGRVPLKLVHDFPIEMMLTNIDVVQKGLPAFGFYGQSKKEIPVFEIEAGQHEKQSSFKRAQECVGRLLRNLDMIDSRPLPGKKPMERPSRKLLEYRICGSIFSPDKSYRCTRVFKNGEFVSKGTPFLTGNGKDIIAPYDCHTLFCPADRKPRSLIDEVMFLSSPVVVHAK